MDTILDLTLKQLEGSDPLQPAANSPARSNFDLNAALQFLKPKSAQTFPDSSFNDPTTMLLLNTLLSNPLNPLVQSLIHSNTPVKADLQPPPAKKPCIEAAALPSVVPTSPSHSASTSSCGSASSAHHSPISWPAAAAPGAQLQRKTPRKPPAPIPEEKKDDAYYERRKKNNDAAKRSRDARRMKEEQTANLAAALEQENLTLRNQIALLKGELAVCKGELAKIQTLLLGASPGVMKKDASD